MNSFVSLSPRTEAADTFTPPTPTAMSTRALTPRIAVYLAALALLLSTASCKKLDDELMDPRSAADSGKAAGGSLASMEGTAEPCKEVCLVAGQHNYVGKVSVFKLDESNIRVTYSLDNVAAPGTQIYLKEVHLEVFTSMAKLIEQKKVNNGNAVPGQFTDKKSFSDNRTSFFFDVDISGMGDKVFYIAAHAALSNGETAWGGDCNKNGTRDILNNPDNRFPGKNWGVFFDYSKSLCPSEQGRVDFTYAWEDLRGDGTNDSDYNDLVIQSDMMSKTPTMMKVRFLAKARGASYEGQFKFRIPKAGIASIASFVAGPTNLLPLENQVSAVEAGNFYEVTVFSSTKAALRDPNNEFANTIVGTTCIQAAMQEITINISNNDAFTAANPNLSTRPFEPFISVYRSRNVNDAEANAALPPYDLYVYEVSGRDTWTANGKEYPNGIVIPRAWAWPTESVNILGPYPNFGHSVGGVVDPNWFVTGSPYPAGTFTACN